MIQIPSQSFDKEFERYLQNLLDKVAKVESMGIAIQWWVSEVVYGIPRRIPQFEFLAG